MQDEKYTSDSDKIQLMKNSDRALGESYPNTLLLLTWYEDNSYRIIFAQG